LRENRLTALIHPVQGVEGKGQKRKAESGGRGRNNGVLLFNEILRPSYQLITFNEKKRPIRQEK
jgi:hypothetical protein